MVRTNAVTPHRLGLAECRLDLPAEITIGSDVWHSVVVTELCPSSSFSWNGDTCSLIRLA